MVTKRPPEIRHVNSWPEEPERTNMLTLALGNLLVPRSASKLMRFYCAQSNGFRPSYNTIDQAIHIGKSNVRTRRKDLADKGLIQYTGSQIIIDWYIIWQLATLDAQMMGKSENWKILPDRTLDSVKPRCSSQDEKQWIQAFAATAQALSEGVRFPELEELDYNFTNLDMFISEEPQVERLEPVKWFDPFAPWAQDPGWASEVPKTLPF